jgi:hypothetical protein
MERSPLPCGRHSSLFMIGLTVYQRESDCGFVKYKRCHYREKNPTDRVIESVIGLWTGHRIGKLWTKQPEQVDINSSVENIFARLESFQRNQFLGQNIANWAIVKIMTRGVSFLARHEAWMSRLLFILWEFGNRTICLKIRIRSENSEVYNSFLREAFWGESRVFLRTAAMSELWFLRDRM